MLRALVFGLLLIVPWDDGITDMPPPPTELGTFVVTNYSLTGIMKDGTYTRPASVAVDPGVIPLGTKLYIEGFGDIQFVARDTGSGVKGNWIDIWRSSHWDAVQFGMQRLRVWRVD